MKGRELIRHLTGHGCVLGREGGKHSLFRNPANGRCSAVPRHREIKDTLARVICDQLGIPRPKHCQSLLAYASRYEAITAGNWRSYDQGLRIDSGDTLTSTSTKATPKAARYPRDNSTPDLPRIDPKSLT